MSKMYIAVLDEFPDYMTPTLVAHSVLNHSLKYGQMHINGYSEYEELYSRWEIESFKKVVVRVNQNEFNKISQLKNVTLQHENKTLDAKKACAVLVVKDDEIPNVLKFAKLWKPK